MSQDYGKIKSKFSLPIQTVTIVPCTTGINKIISKDKCELRGKEVREKMIDLFGGYTEIQGQGGYFSDSLNKKVREPVITVTSYASEQDFKKKKKEWLNYVKKKGKDFKQESMGIIIENDLHYV